LYVQAVRDAVQNRKRQVVGIVRSQAEQARIKADEAQGQTRLPRDYARAEALLQQGLSHEEAERFDDATPCFTDAVAQFTTLARMATSV
jgi:hypothetical protein